jgi:NADH dehydrogenase
MAGSLAELRNTALRASYPEIDPAQVQIMLVEQLADLLAPFDPALRGYAAAQLAERGVEVKLNSAIKEVSPGAVLLASGETLPSDLTIWAAGVQAPAAAGAWGLEQGPGGRIAVEPDLRVRGQDRIFAVGDIAVGGDTRCRSFPSPRCRWAGAAANPLPTTASRRHRSVTTTRGSWLHRFMVSRSCSSLMACGSAARWPG